LVKLSHTSEGEAWRKLVRADPDDPARAQHERDARATMERQKELMALRATVPAIAPVSATPLAGKLRRHELGYKNALDPSAPRSPTSSRIRGALAKRMDRPREAKKLLATLFAAPGTVHVGSRAMTVWLVPAATESERVAIRAFLADIAGRRFSLPGDPDGHRPRLGAQMSDRLRPNWCALMSSSLTRSAISPAATTAANLLFDVVNERHLKQRSMIFTTNKSAPTHATRTNSRKSARRSIGRRSR